MPWITLAIISALAMQPWWCITFIILAFSYDYEIKKRH
jgi:hypothetical protein